MKKGALQVLVFLLLFAYCLAALGPAPPAKRELPPEPPPPPPFAESYFTVSINDNDTQDVSLFLEDKQKNIWVSEKDLTRWNFKIPSSAPMIYQNEKYYAITSIPGLSVKQDNEVMSINVQAPVDAFATVNIDAQGSQTYDYTLPSPGGFFNYNFFGTTVDQGSNQYSLFYTLGIFNQYGVGIGNFLSSTSPDIGYVLRLTTTWTYDKPEAMQTWNFGDTTSTPSVWSGSVNYAGVQWSTNFATQPYFLSFPLRSMKGQATVPSVVDLYVNSSLAMNKQIPPGHFNINNIHLIDGLGNIRMVTTDIQGKEHVVQVPYYSSPSLLKKGLHDFSYEFGILRQDLGVNSNDYSRALVAITESIGLTDTLTIQLHGEALPTQQAAGINVATVYYPLGLFNATLAASRSNTGDGMLTQFGYLFQSQNFSFGLNTQLATNHFTQQAITQGQYAPKIQSQLFTGFNVGSLGTLAVTYTRQVAANVPNISLLTASLSGTLFKEIGYSLTWINTLGGPRNNTMMANLTYSFGTDESGSGTTLSYNNTDANGLKLNTATLSRSLPQGPGYGYNITSTRGGGTADASSNTNQVQLSGQNDIGTLVGQVNATQHQKYIYSLNASGGIVRLDQRFYLTRTVTGSFGLVKMGDFPDVGVYANNLLISKTDSKGNALIPNLLPYDKTTIRIDANKLPFNAQIGETQKVVAPYNFSGIVIPFEAHPMQSATLIVKQTSGEVAPTGATVMVAGQADPFIVADNGEVFLTNLEKPVQVEVTWPGHKCNFTVTPPPPAANNPIPDLGTLVCKE